jgi:type II secretory pathway component PulF
LRTPLITLSFFIAIVLIIFLAIVPSFETLMTSTNQVISPSMGRLFALSTFLQKLSLFGVLAVVVSFGFAGYAFAQLRALRKFGQWMLTHIPGVSGMYWSYELAGFFQAAALLVRGGMPLVQSLQSALSLSGNNYVQSVLAVFVQQVTDGSAVDQAYADMCGNRAHPDIAPLLAVGSQSGMLAQVFEHSARLLFEYVERQLNRTVALSQPIIMSILGIMIAFLLYTVYMPIIELPQTLGALTA